MSIGLADLQSAIVKTWNDSELNYEFRSLWPDTSDTNLPVLHDQESMPKQPFPYCVMGVMDSKERISRSFGSIVDGKHTKHEVRPVRIEFHVHARAIEGDQRSAKEIAGYLAEQVMKVFGGHPTTKPANLTLSNGGHLLTQYESDYPLREELYHYDWIISYKMLVDVPVVV